MTNNNEMTKKPGKKEASRKKRLYERSQHDIRARVSGPDGTWTGIIKAALGPKGEPVLRVDNEVPPDGFDPAGAPLSANSYMDKVHSIAGEIEVLPDKDKRGEPRSASVIRAIRKVRKEKVIGPDGEPLRDNDGEPVIQEIPYAMLKVDPPPEAPTSLT